MRNLLVLMWFLGLSACVAGGGQVLSGGTAPKKQAVLQGGMQVAGPPGFCVIRSGIREDETSAFVPLGPCAPLSGRKQARDPRFLLSASIQRVEALATRSQRETASELKVDMMQAALGEGAEILSSRQQGAALIAKTRGPQPVGELTKTQWRALFLHGAFVVALNVSEFAGATGSEGDGEAILLAFLAQMQAGNPKTEMAAAPPGAQTGPAKFFRRLLN
ncbi:hypothetical protein [Aliiroseovarius crassostreae]|uniref:hypothetical protein n=1 Tax=Aliiroseovarius crassostreae TaxID=154981 RepID=UPI0021FDA5FE|nr:hypothetical protein [Aliiroseovarius crassostreae]UWQ07490.1 hypothetical protein K3X25_12055 [Aliiroseovarius crassostreae]